jgi:hypothetical protein
MTRIFKCSRSLQNLGFKIKRLNDTPYAICHLILGVNTGFQLIPWSATKQGWVCSLLLYIYFTYLLPQSLKSIIKKNKIRYFGWLKLRWLESKIRNEKNTIEIERESLKIKRLNYFIYLVLGSFQTIAWLIVGIKIIQTATHF